MSTYKLYLTQELSPEQLMEHLYKQSKKNGLVKEKAEIELKGEGPEYSLMCKREVADIARKTKGIKKIFCEKV